MLDNVIVLVYLMCVLFLGFWFKRSPKTLTTYGKVGKDIKNNRLILTATIFATAVGGGTTFGIAEKSFSTTLAYTYGLMLTVLIDILIARYIVPRLSEHYGAISVGEIMAKYYGKTGQVVTGIAAILISVGYLAAQISVSARIFEYFLKIGRIEGVVFSYIIVILYTTVGGLRSVVITDILQFFAMVIAVPIIMIVGINKIGLNEFIAAIPPAKYALNSQVLIDTLAAILSFSVMGLHPTFIQRALISAEYGRVQQAIYSKVSVYVFFISFVTINGLIAYILVPDMNSGYALPYVIDTIIPTGIKGLVIVGLLASVMSTADSDLNVASLSIINDVFQPIFNSTNQARLLLAARVTTVIVGILGIILALSFDSVVDLVIFSAGLWSPMIFVPLIGLLYHKKISQQQFLFTVFIGMFSFFFWELYLADIYKFNGVFVGTFASFVCFVTFAHSNKARSKTRMM